jgi:integrase
VERFADKKRTENPKPTDWVFGRDDGSGLPIWDSAVRQCLKRAARAEGCDFKGLGPHSFRRANITWRQEVGASAIEAAKIAGHSSVRMTEHYTKIQIQRQDELTKAIQERLAAAAKGSSQDHEEPPAPPKAPSNLPPASSAPEAPPSLADVPMATQVVQ